MSLIRELDFILNFWVHTIGHAVEAYAGYGQVMHGEAVAIGMVQISKVSERKGLMPEGLTAQIKAVLQKFQLPKLMNHGMRQLYLKSSSMIKKTRGKMIKIVLVPEIGQAQIHETSLQEMKEYLK